MSSDLLNVIGEPFEKLLKAKQRPIFLSQNLNQKKFPFLTQFKQGLKAYAPLEQGTVEEISEDPTETLYFLSLFNEGIVYTVIVSEKKDCWIIRDIRVNKKGHAPASQKGKRRLSLPLLFLIVVSVAGYFYQFGLGKHGKNDNPTLAELYSNQSSTQSKQSAKPASVSGSAAASVASTPSANPAPATWEQQKAALEQEKADLEKQVAALKKENEELRKQVKPAH
jgi:hypothetical protein